MPRKAEWDMLTDEEKELHYIGGIFGIVSAHPEVMEHIFEADDWRRFLKELGIYDRFIEATVGRRIEAFAALEQVGLLPPTRRAVERGLWFWRDPRTMQIVSREVMRERVKQLRNLRPERAMRGY